MKLSWLIVVVLVCSMTACKNVSPKLEGKSTGEPVARAYNAYLYATDLQGIVPAGTPQNDSLEITMAYINNWIRQQLLLKQAEDNLSRENHNFDKQIEQYRNSLIIYAYESELIRQKMDTTVSPMDIEKYYNDNKANFQLRQNIVRVSYVYGDKKSLDSPRIKRLLQSNEARDMEKLKEICDKRGYKYSLEPNAWMPFTELVRKIPIVVGDQSAFLQKSKYYEVSDSLNTYLVRIYDYKTSQSASPVDFESANIKAILLNRRKAEMLKKMEEDIYQQAEKTNKYEIYSKKK